MRRFTSPSAVQRSHYQWKTVQTHQAGIWKGWVLHFDTLPMKKWCCARMRGFCCHRNVITSFLVLTVSTYFIMSGQMTRALSATGRFSILRWPQKGKAKILDFVWLQKSSLLAGMLLKIVCRGLRNFSICQSVNHNSSPLPAEYPQNALHAPAAASIDTENIFLKSRSHIHPKKHINSTKHILYSLHNS